MSRNEGNGHGERFLVFSLPRCGSTTLRRLLNCHPRIRCLEEPFNPFNYDGKYLKQVTDPASLDETLQDIWSTYNGIKHTWCPDGWPFLNRSFNALLLLKPNLKVVYLRRRNFLRRLVSVHIANQTGVWGLFNEHDRKRVTGTEFLPMNIEATRSQLDWDRRLVSNYRNLLVDNGSCFMDLEYEDLYDPAVERRVGMLNRIFAFLGESAIAEDGALARINGLFDPRTMKLNSLETYGRIPGIEELEKQCGSDETGRLFEG